MPPSSFINPKDMSTTYAPPSPPMSSATSQSDPSSQSKSTTSSKKKRKSWGQVLPKPTTNLPPRKRAKTEEEKAQRLYERVQRNRQAAHNSRMRKQDEMEQAVAENNQLKQDVQHLQDEVQRLKAEVAHWRSVSGSSALETKFDRPVTPALDLTSSPVMAPPSLTSASSVDASSPEEDSSPAPSPQFYTPPASDAKPFNDTHSAVMCHTQQWTLNAQAISMEGTGSQIKAS